MRQIEFQFAIKLQRFLKILFRFGRIADDDIGIDRSVGNDVPNIENGLPVFSLRVAASPKRTFITAHDWPAWK